MANTTISPNMSLPVPVVGVDPGPDWATNIDACLSIIDSHNHTTGQGVPITPQAININVDLPFNANNATTLRSVRFSPQSGTISGASDLGCLYENGVDLYYIDGAGNQVRITQGGSVTGASGTITGLPSGTASASFAGSTFTFQSATNTPAAMNFGPVTLGQAVASGKNVTISASGSQAANYNLTLPIALPASSAFVTCDSSGNLGTTLTSTITNGTYNPTLTVVAGSAVSVQTFTYTRVANQVTVFGAISGTTEAGTGNLSYNLTLPINPTANFSTFIDALGGAWPNGGGGLVASSIISNPGTKTVLVSTQVVSGSTAIVEIVTFTYNCS